MGEAPGLNTGETKQIQLRTPLDVLSVKSRGDRLQASYQSPITSPHRAELPRMYILAASKYIAIKWRWRSFQGVSRQFREESWEWLDAEEIKQEVDLVRWWSEERKHDSSLIIFPSNRGDCKFVSRRFVAAGSWSACARVGARQCLCGSGQIVTRCSQLPLIFAWAIAKSIRDSVEHKEKLAMG